MQIRFDDRVAIVTGAGQGLGRSHALYLAARGAKVVVNDLGGNIDGGGNDTTPADDVVEMIQQAGGEAIANYDDVSTPETAADIIQCALDTWGRLDILINNAGILRDKLFLKMSLDDFEAVVRVHLLGSVYTCKAAFPVMRKGSYGRIVLTSSAAGLYGNLGQSNYSAAKLGIVGLMNTLKIEGKKSNIKVNTIAPVADTRMGARVFPDHFKRMIRPELVSAAVAYLASEACDTSGDTIIAGAGFYARAQLQESSGVAFTPDTEVSPEMIAEHYAEILDMKDATPHDSALDSLKKLYVSVGGEL